MINGILGKKVGMTNIFEENGDEIPSTVVAATPCKVIQKKTVATDGYNALQVGFAEIKKEKHIKKPIKGHFEKAKVKPMKYLCEFDQLDDADVALGSEIKVDLFAKGDIVDVSGVSKGKGFAGVMKRYGFKGSPASRGTHESFRGGGSIGMASDPGKVFKGKKMPGHMGAERVTVKNLEVVKVDAEKNYIIIKGAVPGANGGLLEIRKSKKIVKK